MGNMSRNTIKDWARMAAKLGVLLTEPKVRAAVSDQLKDRADYVADTIATKYEKVADRLEAVGDSLQGKSDWSTRAMGFLLGVGIGAGLGILLAPAAGSETREAIREKVMDAKDKVVESASTATRKVRQSVASMPSTGTEG